MQSVPMYRTPVDLKLDREISAAVERVLANRWFVMGEEVERFEVAFAAYCCAEHCVSLANGTDALTLALQAVGVKPGDTVLTAANASFYGSTAIYQLHARPVYVDVSPDSLTIEPEKLDSAAATEKAKAVIVTHLYGQLAGMDAITEIATRHGLRIVEDCAQAHGARKNGRMAGTFGDIGCFSFYPTKNLGAYGDGGAIITQDAELYRRVKQLRQYGWGGKYHVETQGGRNSRLDAMQAAILSVKLPYLDRWNAERRTVAGCYHQAFSNLPIQTPASLGEDYVAHLYVVRVENRHELRACLKENGIATDIHYPVPDHLQAAYACSQQRGSLPVTENACDSVVSLPCFPGLQKDEVDRIIKGIKSYFGK